MARQRTRHKKARDGVEWRISSSKQPVHRINDRDGKNTYTASEKVKHHARNQVA